jgi:hypothetical protein
MKTNFLGPNPIRMLSLLLGVFFLTSCSKEKAASDPTNTPLGVETFPIANSALKNCRFQVSNPTYTQGSTIPQNPIICDEGVARSVQILGPNATLPAGIQFSNAQLSLVGTPTEKVSNAQYQFYLENEAGYVILKMNLTVN